MRIVWEECSKQTSLNDDNIKRKLQGILMISLHSNTNYGGLK